MKGVKLKWIGRDTRGIRWGVKNKINNTYYILFENGHETHLEKFRFKQALKGEYSLTSNITAQEYVGTKYVDRYGNVAKIKSIVKNRPSYRQSIVKIEWENDNYEEDIRLVRIVNKSLVYDKSVDDSGISDTPIKFKAHYRKEYSNSGYHYSDEDELISVKCANVWNGMMRRCFQPIKEHNHTAYKKVKVCDEWYNLSTFAKWFNENYVDGYVMDKDLKGGDLYSPETCIFIPSKLNHMIAIKTEKQFPSGIKKQYLPNRPPITSSIEISGKKLHVGNFNSVIEAFICYKELKEFYIRESVVYLTDDDEIINATNKFEIKDWSQSNITKDAIEEWKRNNNIDKLFDTYNIKEKKDKIKTLIENEFK